MIAPAAASGTLRIAASRRGERTVVDTLRYDGLMRCSRPFPQRGGAARLVVSQLGPGFVCGDRFRIEGDLAPGAALQLDSQAASRALGAGDPSHLDVSWSVGEGAALVCVAEPTIVYGGASHRSRATVTLAPGGSLSWLDAVAPYGSFECFEASLRVFSAGQLAIHDAFRLTPAQLGCGLVSACYVRAGMSAARSAALAFAADAAAASMAACEDLAIGVGSPAAGGVIVRARGARIREIRAALAVMLAELRRIDAAVDAPFV